MAVVIGYRIDLYEIPKRFRDAALLPVTMGSPLNLRKTVLQYARYFREEFHYDFVQFDPEDSEPYTAYLFANEPNHWPRVWIGACCFRSREYRNIGPRQGLQWVWIHPYFRSRGFLKKAWPVLLKAHGDFPAEPPLSRAMLAFLIKYNRDSEFIPKYKEWATHLAVSSSKD